MKSLSKTVDHAGAAGRRIDGRFGHVRLCLNVRIANQAIVGRHFDDQHVADAVGFLRPGGAA